MDAASSSSAPLLETSPSEFENLHKSGIFEQSSGLFAGTL